MTSLESSRRIHEGVTGRTICRVKTGGLWKPGSLNQRRVRRADRGAVYGVQRKVYRVHCTLKSVQMQCSVYNANYKSVQVTVYSVHHQGGESSSKNTGPGGCTYGRGRGAYNVPLYTLQSTLYTVQCRLYTVHCTL